jgi:xanthine dehydrogenase accessory factor
MQDANWNAAQATVRGNVGSRLAEGESGVLVTVVDVEGSAYRRPGAKMLIGSDGSDVGSVSAGCLEPAIERVADEVFDSGRSRVETFGLTGESDDDVWGLGLGCDGIVTLLFEPVTSALEPAAAAFAGGETVVSVTPLEGESVGVRAYFDETGGEVRPAPALPDWVGERAGDVAERFAGSGQSAAVALDGDGEQLEVFVDVMEAQPELVVFGSGHDVAPLVALGRQSGFRVTVVGFRGGTDLVGTFPEADDHVTTSAPTVAEDVRLDERTYAVVMTHNFVDDRLVLEALLDSPVPYVGLMGPRERFEEMREEFGAEGRPLTPEELERVYTPVGLDLGGGEPYQVALSIVSEVMAVHNGREPTHLNEREGPIHPRLERVE